MKWSAGWRAWAQLQAEWYVARRAADGCLPQEEIRRILAELRAGADRAREDADRIVREARRTDPRLLNEHLGQVDQDLGDGRYLVAILTSLTVPRVVAVAETGFAPEVGASCRILLRPDRAWGIARAGPHSGIDQTGSEN